MGSSNSSTRGSPSSAVAMPSRCAMPSEKPPMRRSATSASPTMLQHLGDARARQPAGTGQPAQVPPRGAGPVHRTGVEQRADLPHRRREVAVRPPSTVTVPEVGLSSPRIMRSVVDLPAPLGPRKPVTTPG